MNQMTSANPKKDQPEKASVSRHVAGKRGSLPHPRKAEILESAKVLIMEGKTLAQIAKIEGIGHLTLKLWLSALGDEYKTLRELVTDQRLQEAEQALAEADNALDLKRASEQVKIAQWYAERRDRRFVPQQHVTSVTLDLSKAIAAGRERAGITIDGE